MRLFVAINLSDTMKDALIHVQNEMFNHGIRGNYTREENLHLTLAFIGEYSDPHTAMDALSLVSFSPFTLESEGMGCFGDLWWADMKESAPLNAVVRRIRRALAEREIPFDRKRFSPHITLIRKATGEMPGIQPAPVSMTVTNISLLKSVRGRNCMIYTELGSIEAQ